MHRLDRNTSGALVLARSRSAATRLSHAFRQASAALACERAAALPADQEVAGTKLWCPLRLTDPFCPEMSASRLEQLNRRQNSALLHTEARTALYTKMCTLAKQKLPLQCPQCIQGLPTTGPPGARDARRHNTTAHFATGTE